MTRAYSSRARKTKETHMLDHTSIAWEETLLHHQHWTRAARRIFILTHLIRQYEPVCMDGDDTTTHSCSQEWKSQAFGSPHSSKIIRSYTQGDLLCQSPVFKTQGVLGHPD